MDATPVFDPVKFKTTTRAQWESAAEAWNSWGPFIGRWLAPATEAMLDMAHIGPGSQVLDGERHDTLDEATFDAVISRVGLIYFPDQQGALRGLKRCLKPGGRISVVVYSTPEHNGFFSIPVGIIRRRAKLPPPLPGQPGPFSLGADGVLAATLERAGFRDVEVRNIASPVRLSSAAECVRFERESFGALHQMMAALGPAERDETWQEITSELRRFERADGFSGPCEMLVGAASK